MYKCATSLRAKREVLSVAAVISLPVGRMAPQYEMAVGLKKGHKVTKLQQKPRPSRRRGVREDQL